jgi:hypothetical protein
MSAALKVAAVLSSSTVSERKSLMVTRFMFVLSGNAARSAWDCSSNFSPNNRNSDRLMAQAPECLGSDRAAPCGLIMHF